MTYLKGNVYKEPITAYAHDDCLPDSEFETWLIARYDREDPDQEKLVYDEWRHQREPWTWWPDYLSSKPVEERDRCSYCGEVVP